MLENNQLWEDDERNVLKIEKLGESFRALFFKKEQDTLTFVTMILDDKLRLERLIKKMNMKISNKFITLKEKRNENS
jgi:hypothetical protein